MAEPFTSNSQHIDVLWDNWHSLWQTFNKRNRHRPGKNDLPVVFAQASECHFLFDKALRVLPSRRSEVPARCANKALCWLCVCYSESPGGCLQAPEAITDLFTPATLLSFTARIHGRWMV